MCLPLRFQSLVSVSVLIYRLVLQGLKMSSRLMAVIGLIMTIVATALMGDWQAIRHDTCTDASLFHHPELLHTYTSQMDSAPANISQSELASNVGIKCEKLNLSLGLQQHISSTTIDIHVFPNIATDDVMVSDGCEVIDLCPYCSVEDVKTYSATPTCLNLQVNSRQQCLEKTPLLPWQQKKPHPLSTSYLCTMPKSHFTYCLTLQPLRNSPDLQVAIQEEEEVFVADIHQQTVQIMEGRIDILASQGCREHKAGGHCHWNPSSSLTHRHCDDCPPICRDKTNYLEFSQFTIAAALLLIAVPVARVPITSIISDIVTPEQQVCYMCLEAKSHLYNMLSHVSRELSWDWLRL